ARLEALRLLPDPETLPVAGQSTNAALPPDNPLWVWRLLVEAPGGAGPEIRLAAASLDASDRPVAGTNAFLSSIASDILLRRLSGNPHGEAFGAYLSEPIVLMSDFASEAEVQRYRGRIRMLRAGTRVRVGIPDSMAGNPVLGPFAGTGTPVANPPPNAPPVRLGVTQSRPVVSGTPSLTVDDPVFIRTTVDRANGRACPGTAWLTYAHAHDAVVTITVDGRPLRDVRDENGHRVAEFADVPSLAGSHRLLLDAAMVPEPGNHRLEIRARRFAGLAPNVELAATATIEHEVEIHGTFPIGHTVVQGVDLWDGHLAHSTQDAQLPGRKLSLAFGRTYSSAGDSSDGPLGAGWTHGYNVRLVHDLSCGVYTVVGGEGSGNSFTDPAPDAAQARRYVPLLPSDIDPARLEFFRPQIGYHSVLVRDTSRPNEFWFFSKEALRHDFVADGGASTPSRSIYPLRAIREPNGNSLTLDYLDGDNDPSTLDSVTERDALGQLPKRAFRFEYETIAGVSRIRVLRGFNHQGSRDLLDLEVRYDYDDDGNLIRATRQGPSPETTRIERYRYTPGRGSDGHNLVEYIGPNGAATRYRYAAETHTAGNDYVAGGNLLPGHPFHEIVTNVTHVGSGRSGFEPTSDASHGFRYDFAAGLRHVSEPRSFDSDGVPVPETEYVLNAYGATVRIRAPLGHESEMRWATDHLDGSVLDASGRPVHDVLLTWRRDPEGQEQFLEYHDGRGNLTRQRTVFANSSKRPVTDARGSTVPEVSETFAYDPVFNQRTNVVDAEGSVTFHEIDPRNGNLLRTVDAEGNVTRFLYRPDGDLHQRIDPRGFATTFVEYDPYGNTRRIRDPLGNETITTYDERGRPIETTDAFGHHTRALYDSLDRVVVEMRLNDLSSVANPSAITTNRYDSAGLLLESTGPLGLVTRTFYDALNRPVRSEQAGIRQIAGPALTYTNTVRYDVAGHMIAETDARGVTRHHAYDALGRRTRTSIDGPHGGPNTSDRVLARLQYDRAGNLTNEVDHRGFAIRHVLDGLYRTVESHLPFPATVIATRYDRAGNRSRVTDPDGFATSLEYDRLHRLRRTINAEGHVTEFGYDPSGNRTSIVERVTGRVTTVAYDAAHRETHRTVTGPGLPAAGQTTTTSYDDRGHRTDVTNPRGFVTRTRRDGLDRLVESIHDPGGLDLATRITHDPAGNPLTVTDPEGAAADVISEYDALGRLLRRSFAPTPDDVGDVAESFAYDPVGNLVHSTDRRGIERRFAYDNLGRLVGSEIREPISNGGAWRPLMTTAYDDAANRVVQTDPMGRSITVELDPLGRVRRTLDALGQVQVVENGPVDVLAKTDRRGNRTTYTYDRLHRLRTQTEFDANGVRRSGLSAEYLDAARRVRFVDRRDLVTVVEHDALGRPVRTEREGPDLASRYGANPLLLERREYDSNGNLLRTFDGNGSATEYRYDAADRVTNVIAAAGSSVATTNALRYDRVGNLLSLKDGRFHGGSFDVAHAYDARHRRISTANALGHTTVFRYDAGDNLIERIEPLGFATRYEYDELGALVAVDETPRSAGAVAGITRFRYDPNGNLVAQQDALGNLVTRAYDALNRLTNLQQHTLPGTLSSTVRRSGPFGGGAALGWTLAYDPEGNPVLGIDPRGQRVEASFDHLNRLVERKFSNHAEVDTTGKPLEYQALSLKFAYDGNGNLLESVEEKQGSAGSRVERTAREFDGLDRLISTRRFDHDDPAGRGISYAYDVAGNRTDLTDPDARVTRNAFDALHRLKTVDFDPGTPGAMTATFEWEPDGLLRRVAFPGGTSTVRTYDAADRLVALTNAASGPGAPHSVFRYAYDANGNRIQQTEIQPGAGFGTETVSYGYDSLNRLVRVAYGTAGALDYTYDANGNRLGEKGTDPVTGLPVDRSYRYGKIASRAATTFDGVNALARIEDHVVPANSVDYDYDGNLNQIGRVQGTNTKRFRFDIRDQIVAADVAGAVTKFDYDARRLRAKKISATGMETRYLYDEASVLLEYGS
ncbi:MAG: RHS repeat protein, partial [Verrucomicrobiales bacterium]|nr:RHS repeat protein [Verrucomicrobiales bacterium]